MGPILLGSMGNVSSTTLKQFMGQKCFWNSVPYGLELKSMGQEPEPYCDSYGNVNNIPSHIRKGMHQY
jgi:hypothetical protein